MNKYIVSAVVLICILVSLMFFVVNSDDAIVTQRVDSYESSHVRPVSPDMNLKAVKTPVVEPEQIEPSYAFNYGSSSKNTKSVKQNTNAGNPVQEVVKKRYVVAVKNLSQKGALYDEFGGILLMRNGFVVMASDVSDFEQDERIDSVTEDIQLSVAMAETGPLIKYDYLTDYFTANNMSYSGAGRSVCIVDTGIDWSHDDFGNCSSYSNCSKIVYGYDHYMWSANYSDPMGHGTAIAGVLGADGAMQGMLPEVRFVAMKVTDDIGLSWASLIDNAVYACVDNATLWNVSAIIVGLSSDKGTITPAYCTGPLPASFNYAHTFDIPVVVPSGNDGYDNNLGYPSVCNNAVSVAGVYDNGPNYGGIWPTGNRDPQYLDLLATGDRVLTTGLNDLYVDTSGTSMSAALVTGAFMLLEGVHQQLYGLSYSSDDLLDVFRLTGDFVNDSGTLYPRISLQRALHYEPFAPVVSLLTANNTVQGENATLNYTVSDHHDILNCTLNISGSTLTRTDVVVGAVNEFLVSLPNGVYEWSVTCYDNSTFPNVGFSETRILYIISGSPPTFSPIPNLFTDEDTAPLPLDLWNYTSDHDTPLSNLSFSITLQTNPGLINCSISGNRYFSCGTPAADASGNSAINIFVDDGFFNDTAYFDVVVVPVNDAPVFSSVPPVSINEDSTPPSPVWDLAGYVSDVDNTINQLVFTIIDQSNSALINCNIVGTEVMCNSPAQDQFGSSDITVLVSDGSLNDTAILTLTVNPMNDDPVLTNLPVTLTVNETSFVSYNIESDDVDNDTIAYSLLNPSPGMGLNGGLFSWTTGVAGTYTVDVLAEDGNGGSDTESITIIVLPIPKPDVYLQGLFLQPGSYRAFSAVMRNLGNVTTGFIPYEFDFGNYSESGSFDAILPGQLYVHTFHAPNMTGNATLVLDPSDVIFEWDENNNAAFVQVI